MDKGISAVTPPTENPCAVSPLFSFACGTGNHLRRSRNLRSRGLHPGWLGRLRRHHALTVGGSPTLKTHPQEPPTRVGRKRNGKEGGFASPSGGKSRRRFTASLFVCGSGNDLRCRRDFATGGSTSAGFDGRAAKALPSGVDQLPPRATPRATPGGTQ